MHAHHSSDLADHHLGMEFVTQACGHSLSSLLGIEVLNCEPDRTIGGRFDRESPSRHTRNVKVEKIDPWFLKPYEEGTAPASATPAKSATPPPELPGKPRKTGVGALLGGTAKKT